MHWGNFSRNYTLSNRRPVDFTLFEPELDSGYPIANEPSHSHIVIYHYLTRSVCHNCLSTCFHLLAPTKKNVLRFLYIMQLSEARAKGAFVKEAYEKKQWWGTGRWIRTKTKNGIVKKTLIMGQEFMDWVNKEADESPERCLDAQEYAIKARGM